MGHYFVPISGFENEARFPFWSVKSLAKRIFWRESAAAYCVHTIQWINMLQLLMASIICLCVVLPTSESILLF